MKIKKIFLLFISFTLIILCFIPRVYGYNANIAYIYISDSASAYSYKTLFNNNRFQTDLIYLPNITTGTFNNYDIIIMGLDTGYNDTWYGNPSQMSIINSTELPIIGVGVGGFTFFGINGLNLTIGYGLGYYSSFDEFSIETLNNTHEIFNKPNDLPKGLIDIDYVGCTTCCLFFLEIPSNIMAFGRIPPFTYTHLIEDERYFLWGFSNTPNTMTEIGKDLFINVLNYYSPPADSNGFFGRIPGYNLFILIGIFSLSTLILLKKKINN